MARPGRPPLTLRGSEVAFTGYLSRLRAVVAKDVVRRGGVFSVSVSHYTTILVQGFPNAAYKYDTIGVKLDTVQRLRRAGYPIAVIREAELETLIAGRHLTPAQTRAAYVDNVDPLGVPYRFQTEPVEPGVRSLPYLYDPYDLDRATRAHMILQNRVARAAKHRGLHPLSPSGPPFFDVVWNDGRTTTIVEVKSLTTTNEASQIRLGLGQILDYKSMLLTRGIKSVKGAICLPHAPSSRRYIALCQSVGVHLSWPPTFRALW